MLPSLSSLSSSLLLCPSLSSPLFPSQAPSLPPGGHGAGEVLSPAQPLPPRPAHPLQRQHHLSLPHALPLRPRPPLSHADSVPVREDTPPGERDRADGEGHERHERYLLVRIFHIYRTRTEIHMHSVFHVCGTEMLLAMVSFMSVELKSINA